MNNYSWFEKALHKFVLSPKFMREISFEIESSALGSAAFYNGRHIFVCGLPRSGTTTLLNAIHYSGLFASLTYEDMPFVLAPNIWKKINDNDDWSFFYDKLNEIKNYKRWIGIN